MILIYQNLCDYCGTCVAVCPPDAISLAEAHLSVDEEKCTDCKLCVFVCPVESLEYVE